MMNVLLMLFMNSKLGSSLSFLELPYRTCYQHDRGACVMNVFGTLPTETVSLLSSYQELFKSELTCACDTSKVVDFFQRIPINPQGSHKSFSLDSR